MANSFIKYCHLVVRHVMDIIEVTPTQQPYKTLKERLLSHFKMSEYTRLDKLFTMPDLGGRKPSAMLELCSHGEEITCMFTCLFLHCLPKEAQDHVGL
jgi:hypothetical protein